MRESLPEGEQAPVVYVDYEDVAAAHARVLLGQEGATGWAAMVQRDLREGREVLTDPGTRRLVDRDRPVCLPAVAVLHFIGPGTGWPS
ncbi:MAG TPA: SAM-dependent methyltransferase [Amycolatopsis sp.]|uniref:SAM-dependent methyltransferase n=1 Tax=Amycolatopsis sp. TaxID=37632 RepID=UPI002B46FA34|nr:SAM-dependent methyltransferase [Amycolatopsis sp.]HKS49178.1 SAM-dependent methyltransferase [Amycolatopsis sp.]